MKIKNEKLLKEDQVKLLNIGDDCDPMWGCGSVFITKAQLEEFMKGGKVLYFDDGEYAHLVYLASDVEIREKVKPSPIKFNIIREEDL